jgi:glutamate N-acetyltransferase/amino-acid N-acetyltransferase
VSVTSAKGFRASGVTAGIKASGKPDVALVVNDGPNDVAAAVFTSNRFKAAPVQWSEQVIKDSSLRGVFLNSGGANACTGPEGFADTHRTAEHVADRLSSIGMDVAAGDLGICSTGLIGERLPMETLLAGVDLAVAGLSSSGGDDAATAIMTTDTVAKTATASGEGFVVGGMAKGAGMLAPALATMLVVITTDADISSEMANIALREAVSLSFDRIDSDGCMSTNDAVFLLANGASAVSPSSFEFTEVLTRVCMDLARQLIADAEGASKDIEIHVRGAESVHDALEVARAISRSNLLKCAIHGEDPNWGRVLSATGTTNAAFDPWQVDVALNGVWVCRNGGVGDSRGLVSLAGREVRIEVNLNHGSESATIWTNDLTADYVHENSAYAT